MVAVEPFLRGAGPIQWFDTFRNYCVLSTLTADKCVWGTCICLPSYDITTSRQLYFQWSHRFLNLSPPPMTGGTVILTVTNVNCIHFMRSFTSVYGKLSHLSSTISQFTKFTTWFTLAPGRASKVAFTCFRVLNECAFLKFLCLI